MFTSLVQRLGTVLLIVFSSTLALSQTRELTPVAPKLIGSFLHYPSINTDFPAYGFVPSFFSWDVRFTTSARNDGSVNETNVNGVVKKYSVNGNLLNQLPTSSIQGTLPPGPGLAHLGTTSPFFLGQNGIYDFEISVLSDSVGQGRWAAKKDTIRMVVSDSTYATDFGGFNNEVGSGLIGVDGFGVASFFHLDHSLDVGSIEVGLGPNTSSGGVLAVSIYDTVGGFSFINGFSNPPVTTVQHVISPTDVQRGFAKFSMLSNGTAPVMDSSVSRGYYVYVRAETNSGATPIQFINDTTVYQPSMASLFYSTASGANRWYFGFAGTAMVNAFQIRINVSAHIPDSATSISEQTFADLKIAPNPASDFVTVPLDDASQKHTIRIVNKFGQLVYQHEFETTEQVRISVEDLPSGVYIISTESEGGKFTRAKLIIE